MTFVWPVKLVLKISFDVDLPGQEPDRTPAPVHDSRLSINSSTPDLPLRKMFAPWPNETPAPRHVILLTKISYPEHA
jgi:hypothetical protein